MKKVKIAVIDCGGNTGSIVNALEFIGADASLILPTDRKALKWCDKIILPGQGRFGEVMRKLEPIRSTLLEEVRCGKPFLGICVGYQILFDKSEESPGIKGLGLIKGSVVRFRKPAKLPHIGWNLLRSKRGMSDTKSHDVNKVCIKGTKYNESGKDTSSKDTNIKEIDNCELRIFQRAYVYFVHSYYPVIQDEPNLKEQTNVQITWTTYGDEFASAIKIGNICGTQFHPEKSGEIGLSIIKNWIRCRK
ncbi:imidazole glycerol phosphate synthase subunit HisH [Candidatus Woesearchaeota archaeon]|nr:imidazole glycerol phosphate synthase subunit HisH [Candidatus Woesearchaeota archaeon]